jgi:hypothetical protein
MTLKLTQFNEEMEKEFDEKFGIKVGGTYIDILELEIVKSFLAESNKKAFELAVEEISKIIKLRLKYCEEQNGRDYCKNCGLCEEDLLTLSPKIELINKSKS